jgi:biotin operon repressor
VNFQQLKIIREAARRDYNLTEVANMLYTSQSGVSRHIRELEEELGIEIFIRRGKRLLGMTEPGKACSPLPSGFSTRPATCVAWRIFYQRCLRRAHHRHHPHPGALQPAAGD